MIDGRDTSLGWAEHGGTICILPVGSFEQHGSHLPLCTDAVMAEDIARRLAQELDAALLPALQFATSLEHSGMAGTFTLRPETLMQIIRDLAGEAEKQGFETMVVVNAHGGNHCLIPVIRDLNRSDRGLKILLLYTADFRPKLAEMEGLMDIHAGANETSLMVYRFPDLVASPRPDRPQSSEKQPLQQPDLTTFGVSHFNPEGVIGRSSLADAEKGRRLYEQMIGNMLIHIDDRLKRLSDSHSYQSSRRLRRRSMSQS